MRSHGALVKWNDERGFGFIALEQSREEIFVHVSAFPRDGVRPRIGETVSFTVIATDDGRKRAQAVRRAGTMVKDRAQRSGRRASAPRSGLLSGVLSMVLFGAIGLALYGEYTKRVDRPEPRTQMGVKAEQSSYRCDGRTHCSQMTSCAEASYFLSNCPGAQMDGNRDGVPCEQQWCN